MFFSRKIIKKCFVGSSFLANICASLCSKIVVMLIQVQPQQQQQSQSAAGSRKEMARELRLSAAKEAREARERSIEGPYQVHTVGYVVMFLSHY